jgi:hypothetical protein
VDVSAWQEVISVMRRHLASCLRRELKWRRSAEDIWHRARASVSHLAERIQARKWLAEAELCGELHRAGNDLLNAEHVPALADALALTLARLKIRACFVALADGAQRYRGLFSIAGDQIEREFAGPFSRARLMPEALLAEGPATTWLVKPLSIRQHVLGYAVFAVGPKQGRTYAMLRDYLSAAVSELGVAPGLRTDGLALGEPVTLGRGPPEPP